MKIRIAILSAFTLGITSMSGQDTSVALAPGSYLLVYGDKLTQLHVSFNKTADNKMTLSCPDAPLSPSAVFQQDGLFQFSILYPDAKQGTLRCLSFAGYSLKRKSGGDTVIRGAFVLLAASGAPQSPGIAALKMQGSFILYKLADND